MAWNMQFHASRSWNTESSENQPASPSTSSTPSDYAELHEHIRQHVKMAMESLEALTIHETSFPISPKMPSDRIFVANTDFQRDLTWDHLPDDIENWLHHIEVHPAPRWSISTPTATQSEGRRRKLPSRPIPTLNIFTDIQWQRSTEEYSPSVYSPQSSGISPCQTHPARTIARDVMGEMPLSPTQYISMDDILDLAANIADLNVEVRATVNRVEDSNDSDFGSNMSVCSLELVEPLPTSTITFYDLAHSRGLTISDSSPASSDDGSQTSSIDRRERHSNAPSPNQSEQSYVRVRHHNISPGILNRMACLANSGLTIQLPHSSVHEFALPTDGSDEG